jgi:hypothetical protein
VTITSYNLEGSKENLYYVVSTPKLSICLNRIAQVKAIINTRAKINIIT